MIKTIERIIYDVANHGDMTSERYISGSFNTYPPFRCCRRLPNEIHQVYRYEGDPHRVNV